MTGAERETWDVTREPREQETDGYSPVPAPLPSDHHPFPSSSLPPPAPAKPGDEGRGKGSEMIGRDGSGPSLRSSYLSPFHLMSGPIPSLHLRLEPGPRRWKGKRNVNGNVERRFSSYS